MREHRVVTRQAHPVPSKVTRPGGPFPPELLVGPEIVTDYLPDEDHSPPGATAQNNFRPEALYQCRGCGMQVFESDIASHFCP